MKLRLLTFSLIAGLAMILAACAPKGPTVIHVTLTEFEVKIDRTSVPAGPVTFEITNNGALTHELVLEASGSHDEPFEANGVKSEKEDIEPGTTASFDWTLEAGEYQLACYVPGHFEAGMHVGFTVK